MLRATLDSTCVASVGYDPARRILEIEYRGGGVYRYLGVPPEEHEALMGAESAGAFVNQRIKTRYAYERVDEK